MIHKLIAVCAGALLCSVAVANDDDDDKDMRSVETTFKSLDRNADERLSQTEVSNDQTLSQHFAALDKDSDGFLTKREYAGHMQDKQKEGRQY